MILFKVNPLICGASTGADLRGAAVSGGFGDGSGGTGSLGGGGTGNFGMDAALGTTGMSNIGLSKAQANLDAAKEKAESGGFWGGVKKIGIGMFKGFLAGALTGNPIKGAALGGIKETVKIISDLAATEVDSRLKSGATMAEATSAGAKVAAEAVNSSPAGAFGGNREGLLNSIGELGQYGGQTQEQGQPNLATNTQQAQQAKPVSQPTQDLRAMMSQSMPAFQPNVQRQVQTPNFSQMGTQNISPLAVSPQQAQMNNARRPQLQNNLRSA